MEITVNEAKQILSAKDVYEILLTILSKEDSLDQDKEHFWAVGLDTKNRIKYIELVYLGTATHCVCRASEIFRRACVAGVVNIIVAHSHPSGDPNPSVGDRKMTKTLSEAGGILGIKLLDHVIVGDPTFFSFAEAGEI